MREFEVKTMQWKDINKIICDKCGREIPEDDLFEFQEAYSIEFTGGFGSVFGDMSEVICDLCQHCLKELIGEFCWYDGERQVRENIDTSPCHRCGESPCVCVIAYK